MVELPYQKDSMSTIIILPNRNKNIKELIFEMSDVKMQCLIKKINERNEEIILDLPKFELRFESGLNDVLGKLGIHDAFNERLTDFSKMREEKDLFINNVIQKIYLKVDEEGAEAAAVTGIKITEPVSDNQKPNLIIPFIIDRPFLFMIRNRYAKKL